VDWRGAISLPEQERALLLLWCQGWHRLVRGLLPGVALLEDPATFGADFLPQGVHLLSAVSDDQGGQQDVLAHKLDFAVNRRGLEADFIQHWFDDSAPDIVLAAEDIVFAFQPVVAIDECRGQILLQEHLPLATEDGLVAAREVAGDISEPGPQPEVQVFGAVAGFQGNHTVLAVDALLQHLVCGQRAGGVDRIGGGGLAVVIPGLGFAADGYLVGRREILEIQKPGLVGGRERSSEQPFPLGRPAGQGHCGQADPGRDVNFHADSVVNSG